MRTEPHEVRARAREWLLRMSSGEAGEKDRAALKQWLEESPANASAFEDISNLWGELGQLDEARLEVPDQEPDMPSLPTSHRSRWAWAVAASVLLAVFMLSLLQPSGQLEPATEAGVQQYATAHGSIQQVSLPDGSEVTLGAYSRITLQFDDSSRDLTLLRGEAVFTVAPDASRPFTVNAGKGSTRAVGTIFAVRLVEQRVQVDVAEGTVEVASAGGHHRVAAGQRSGYHAESGLDPVTATDARSALAWRDGHREYHDTPLRELVADLNRYSATPILLTSRSLADTPITAAFEQFETTDQVLDAIENALPATVVRTATGIHIRAR